MIHRPKRRRRSIRSRLRRIADPRLAFCLSVLLIIISLFLLRGLDIGVGRRSGDTRLTASPSPYLDAAVRKALNPNATDFESSLVDAIRTRRCVTVTVHVALWQREESGRSANALGDGSNPRRNMYWGALFGMETHFANAAGWRRALTDDGDGGVVIQRVLFHRRAAPTPAWQARGINEAFDVYVLANAWPAARIVEAMEQPLRDAVCGEPIRLAVDQQTLEFGGGSQIVGYVGQNHMLEEYWDPFSQLAHCRPSRQVGVFYACSRSAVVLHAPVVEHGLYSVLFTRSTLTPEAYLIDGMLTALLSGELGDAFLSGAAAEYSRYQSTVSFERAMSMLYR